MPTATNRATSKVTVDWVQVRSSNRRKSVARSGGSIKLEGDASFSVAVGWGSDSKSDQSDRTEVMRIWSTGSFADSAMTREVPGQTCGRTDVSFCRARSASGSLTIANGDGAGGQRKAWSPTEPSNRTDTARAKVFHIETLRRFVLT